MLGEVPTVRANSIGDDYKELNKLQQSQETKFMPAEEIIDPYTGEMMLKHHTQHPRIYPIPKFESDSKPQIYQRPENPRRYRRWVCHHCWKQGHIRPFCYKLHGYPK
jgi:hypothetical protein